MTQIRLYLTARKPEAHHIASILDPQFEEEGLPAVLFEDEANPGNWCYSVYCAPENKDEIQAFMTEKLGSDLFGLEIEEEILEDIDWVSETLRELTPVEAGRFFVHGSHDRDAAAHKRIPIEIDAGQAFGTGHHGTTAGCLDMLEVCLRRRKPMVAMDIGTGSGVLAIALAKACHTPVLATDIDPIATKTAHENTRLNGVANDITCVTATGFDHPAFDSFGPADLMFANILARPLEALARPMRRHLAPGADVILSGLLPHQRARIVAAYRRQGLVLDRWHVRDDWLTILMKVP